jgi:hypothetical protein
MAKVNVSIPKDAPGEKVVVLRMDEDESNTLMVLLEHINGDVHNSPRKYTDAIWAALVSATGADPDVLPQHALMANHEALGFSFKNFDGTTPPALQARIDAEQKGEQAYGASDDLQTFLNSLLP